MPTGQGPLLRGVVQGFRECVCNSARPVAPPCGEGDESAVTVCEITAASSLSKKQSWADTLKLLHHGAGPELKGLLKIPRLARVPLHQDSRSLSLCITMEQRSRARALWHRRPMGENVVPLHSFPREVHLCSASEIGTGQASGLWPVTFMALGFWWAASMLRILQLKYLMSLFFAEPQTCTSVFYFFDLVQVKSFIGAIGGPQEAVPYCNQPGKSCTSHV